MFLCMKAEGTMSEAAIPSVSSALQVNATCIFQFHLYLWSAAVISICHMASINLFLKSLKCASCFWATCFCNLWWYANMRSLFILGDRWYIRLKSPSSRGYCKCRGEQIARYVYSIIQWEDLLNRWITECKLNHFVLF